MLKNIDAPGRIHYIQRWSATLPLAQYGHKIIIAEIDIEQSSTALGVPMFELKWEVSTFCGVRCIVPPQCLLHAHIVQGRVPPTCLSE